MAERRFYAWVPFSIIEPILKKEELTPGDLAVDPLYVPGGSNPEKFRRIWIANMREAMKSGAFPWDSGQIGSNPDKKLQ